MYVNDQAPEYMSELFSSCSSINTYSLRSSTSNNIHVQRPILNFEKRTFHYSGTTLWNFLPVTLEESKSLEHFKRNSKIYFLRNQENEIT